jgi:hypothetical protein
MVLQKVDDKKAEGTPSAFRHFAQIGRPLTDVGGRNFIIPQPQQFVKRKVAQKLNNYFSHNCAT